jgi:hypothetical protein
LRVDGEARAQTITGATIVRFRNEWGAAFEANAGCVVAFVEGETDASVVDAALIGAASVGIVRNKIAPLITACLFIIEDSGAGEELTTATDVFATELAVSESPTVVVGAEAEVGGQRQADISIFTRAGISERLWAVLRGAVGESRADVVAADTDTVIALKDREALRAVCASELTTTDAAERLAGVEADEA